MTNYKSDAIAFITAIILSIILGFIIIPLLKKLKAGQNILGYVDNHAGKAGTTTMGGFIFALATLIVFIFSSKGANSNAGIALLVSLCFLVVGFLDDYIKIKSKSNQGLTAKQKIIFQTLISLLTALFIYFKGSTVFFIPFLNKYLDFGVFSIFVVFFVFLATTNCVNLTDGLDGLAGGVSYVYLLLAYLLLELQIVKYPNNFANVFEAQNIALLLIVEAGALIGFLLFNTFSASS